MIFQAAIFQTSAAIEDYLKSMFDDWVFNAKRLALNSSTIPMRVRSSMAAQIIAKPIYRFAADNDEAELLRRLEQQGALWDLLHGGAAIPAYVEGSHVYKDRKYPSPKNIKVLFFRLGVDDVFGRASHILGQDAEMRLVSFNSVRTALAHAQPPQLTYLDVKRNIVSVQSVIRAFDRIAHKALTSHLGQPAW